MEREMYRFENASFHLRIDSIREAGVGDLVTDTPPGWPPPPTWSCHETEIQGKGSSS